MEREEKFIIICAVYTEYLVITRSLYGMISVQQNKQAAHTNIYPEDLT
jgi:hypothetical protein